MAKNKIISKEDYEYYYDVFIPTQLKQIEEEDSKI